MVAQYELFPTIPHRDYLRPTGNLKDELLGGHVNKPWIRLFEKSDAF
jgi:hypothetical protein